MIAAVLAAKLSLLLGLSLAVVVVGNALLADRAPVLATRPAVRIMAVAVVIMPVVIMSVMLAPMVRADSADDQRLAIGACAVLSMGYTFAQAVQEVEEKMREDGEQVSADRAREIVSSAIVSGCH
jgi:hypothetical protein